MMIRVMSDDDYDNNGTSFSDNDHGYDTIEIMITVTITMTMTLMRKKHLDIVAKSPKKRFSTHWSNLQLQKK